ncbi:MAG: hypothetical protein KY463_05370 [Actinobacteria bacterium]|nr:hypothetical protein [Actinomycetota bacterium]
MVAAAVQATGDLNSPYRALYLLPVLYGAAFFATRRFVPLLAPLNLLVGLGLHCRKHYRPGAWCSNNRDDTLCDFAIARAMLGKVTILADTAFRLLLAATVDAAPNWR